MRSTKRDCRHRFETENKYLTRECQAELFNSRRSSIIVTAIRIQLVILGVPDNRITSDAEDAGADSDVQSGCECHRLDESCGSCLYCAATEWSCDILRTTLAFEWLEFLIPGSG